MKEVSDENLLCPKYDFIIYIFIAFTYLHFHTSDCKLAWAIVDPMHNMRSERRWRN